jgi:hypothetical protein
MLAVPNDRWFENRHFLFLQISEQKTEGSMATRLTKPDLESTSKNEPSLEPISMISSLLHWKKYFNSNKIYIIPITI